MDMIQPQSVENGDILILVLVLSFIVADVHRVECPEHGVHTEMVPWASHNSSYTKEFEQQYALLALRLNKKESSLE